jgi:pantothenate kinase
MPATLSWDQVDELAEWILVHTNNSSGGRTLIALSGAPASGKSTLAARVSEAVNRRLREATCVVVGMDGFHLTRAKLAALPNAAEAVARRGAAWTFDVAAFGNMLQALRTDVTVRAPTFDHATKDPVQRGTLVLPSHRVVFVEGLYCLLNQTPWNTLILPQFHARWFIDCPLEVCEARIVPRHVATGVCGSPEEAAERWVTSDGLNGRLILENLDRDAVDVWIVAPETI